MSKHQKRSRKVSVWRINILPQVRQTFEIGEQEEISASIAEKGVLNPPIVALYNRAEVENYLMVMNGIWGSALRIDGLRASQVAGKKHWYVLLAGERRMRSYCPLVREGKMPRLLGVTVHEHIDPLDAVDIQFAENSHRRVPAHEEAYAFTAHWAFLKKKGISPTLAGYARQVGRSPSTIKAALRFVALPSTIRNAVSGRWSQKIPDARLFKKENLKLAYGIAVELAKLAEIEETETQLVQRMVTAVVMGVNVERFRKDVSQIIQAQRQETFDFLTADADGVARKHFHRATLLDTVGRILTAEEGWLSRVLHLADEGLIQEDELPFSDRIVRRRLIRVAELFEEVHNTSYKRPPRKAKKRLKRVQKIRKILERIEASEPTLPFLH